MSFEPTIIGFLCDWCAYEGADSAGKARKEYPAGLKIIRMPCAGRMDPQLVMEAFRAGADGVMIMGCHPGDCHYKEGNYTALKRYHLLRKTLAQFGIEEERLQLNWVAAHEGEAFARLAREMDKRVRELGHLWPSRK